MLISPVLLGLALAAIAWAAAPALDRDTRLLACLVLLTQPTVLAYTSVGRPDHHSLLLLLAVILIGLTARLAATPGDRRAALLAGAIAGVGIWISPEAMTFIGVSLAALGLFWLAGTAGLARANRDYLLAAAATLAGGLLLERAPAELFALESDRLSIVHVLLFALLAGFWVIIGRAERAGGGGLLGRASAAVARYAESYAPAAAAARAGGDRAHARGPARRRGDRGAHAAVLPGAAPGPARPGRPALRAHPAAQHRRDPAPGRRSSG